jgi:hypothetical protein
MINDENLPNVTKTKHPKKGEKITRWKDPNLGKKKKSPTEVDHEGNMNISSTQTPLSQGTYEIRRGEEHLKERLA